MAIKQNTDMRDLGRFNEKVRRLKALFQESEFRFFLPNWPLSEDARCTLWSVTQKILYCQYPGLVSRPRSDARGHLQPPHRRKIPKGLLVLQKETKRMTWTLHKYGVEVQFLVSVGSQPSAFLKVLRARGLKHVVDETIFSTSREPEDRFKCLLALIQVVEILQEKLIARIVRECRQERLRIEARFGSVREAIEKSLHPFFLLRAYLIPRLERYVGKTRSHRAIIEEAREAFGILVPYMVADQLGKGPEGGQNG